MSGARRILLIAVIAFVAAVAGVFVGRAIMNRPAPTENELHALIHHKLDLDARQAAQLEILEKQFAIRKHALELDMLANNARLATAIEAEHGYGPGVSAAIDHTHLLMGRLQKETLEHVFAMRGLLRPDQARKFDEAVVKALTAPAR
jgi:hypothetical protein